MPDSTDVTFWDRGQYGRGAVVPPDDPYDHHGLEGIRAALWAHKPGSVVRRLMATIDEMQSDP